ncbi:hypothetical protein CXK86_03780 [Paenibacillus sp. BGI2013]|uniref:hypothetical protein n=1 Tax=Paenibacillus TaxID=44249 RepID=UPI00096F0312|nr:MULTISPECIES: hypothetical protein [Paenibacillus]OMF47818.1 hypothetical protein BK136_02690 [Paenibacillus amylolyticus]PKQ93236.1 hypothetical protein CXK86_03780 [Paenibacillus sp. BGI2013]
MNIVHSFQELVVRGDHQGMIELLKNYEQSRKLSVHERGWVYWNVSDGYALLREPEPLYANHREFFEWGKENLAPEQLHWIVSDSTQALSLSLGNYFDHWMDWYQYACDNAPKLDTNRGVRFESHRALGGSLWVLERYSEMDSVLENMNQLIQEDETWSNILFARITYNKQRLAYLYHVGEVREVNLLLDETLNLINKIDWSALDQIKNQEVVGSWRQLNSSSNSQRDVHIAMNNLACILTDIEKVEESVGLFRRLQDNGYALNGYAFSKYVCSVWKSEGVEAVREVLGANKSFEIAELIKHSPMLSEIED